MDGSVDFAEFYATILRVRLRRSASHRTAEGFRGFRGFRAFGIRG